jgi:hypothetical protein
MRDRIAPSRLLRRVIWQPDKWERLAVTAAFAGDAATVADVGGRRTELAKLLPRATVTTVNVEPPADLLFDGLTVPMGDDSVDAATSSDVIEHIAPEGRSAHLKELVRIARRRVVLCCPLGSPYHQTASEEMAQWLTEQLGRNLPFLEEHLENGLPTQDELSALVDEAAPTAKVTWRYHADIDELNHLLRTGVRARWGHDPMALARYATMALRPSRPVLDERPHPRTGRVFVTIDLA